MPPVVIMMCGLPASGKTTTAARLHARLGGALVRSCDVYRTLGISVPAWVRRTAGFTRDVERYEVERDRAYVVMRGLVEERLRAGASPVIVDAVHGERSKREVLYEVCRAGGGAPMLVWCRCEAWAEVRRRFAARQGRDAEPEHEAADLSVYRHIHGLWQEPTADPPVAAGHVPVLAYDTLGGGLAVVAGRNDRMMERVRHALAGSAPARVSP